MKNIIDIQNVSKHFGSFHAVDDISFSVESGSIFGFLGPNGAGKSTTIKCIMNFITPTAGHISLFGKDAQKDGVELKSRIGYVAGDVHVEEKWTGQRHIDFVVSLGGDKAYANELIERFHFDPTKKAKKLSSGNRQKLGLIMALITRPELLILDEPTTGLDPFLQQAVYDIIEEMRDAGSTILMSSHNLNEVERVCDTVAIIREGKMVATEKIVELRKKRLYGIQVHFSEPVEQDQLEHEVIEVMEQYNSTAMLQGKGDITEILKFLHTLPIDDIEISHARLEDIFMEYYA